MVSFVVRRYTGDEAFVRSVFAGLEQHRFVVGRGRSVHQCLLWLVSASTNEKGLERISVVRYLSSQG
jgi:hypothetical protein